MNFFCQSLRNCNKVWIKEIRPIEFEVELYQKSSNLSNTPWRCLKIISQTGLSSFSFTSFKRSNYKLRFIFEQSSFDVEIPKQKWLPMLVLWFPLEYFIINRQFVLLSSFLMTTIWFQFARNFKHNRTTKNRVNGVTDFSKNKLDLL